MSFESKRAKAASLLLALLLVVPARAMGDEACPHHKQGTATAAPAPKAPSSEVRLVEAGLVDQDGTPVRLGGEVIGDRLVVMNFVFTTCTTVCPVLSAIFSRVQGRLGDRLGKEVQLVSLSVDPTRDTPARLKDYATRLRAKAGWTWLTGGPENVKQVLQGLGAYTPSYANHTPMVLIGDARTGTWVRLNGFPSEEQILAKVDELAAARRARAENPAP
ncbi:protein SCO1/2 [Archangium gephyra]|uniref:Cytochrome oxidase biogenesis protein Sco1/SenC/PrrC, putative copper metallochaperone n=1 Tax=Archangium gephyra TaxID=48 RepID=A0AAC8QFF7_9BACT|nr:SCO family protein [Archangium gephyra]AKJ06753.1 Cytochrome oxidase biogenesis protein Sco1/SenC/PrrC, putative copper metallochaperone [Archangium gephyra]REG31948.1 protein SCO1/2 [Archangium gephyra]